MILLKCISHHVEAIEAHVSIRKSIKNYFPIIYPLRLHPKKENMIVKIKRVANIPVT